MERLWKVGVWRPTSQKKGVGATVEPVTTDPGPCHLFQDTNETCAFVASPVKCASCQLAQCRSMAIHCFCAAVASENCDKCAMIQFVMSVQHGMNK